MISPLLPIAFVQAAEHGDNHGWEAIRFPWWTTDTYPQPPCRYCTCAHHQGEHPERRVLINPALVARVMPFTFLIQPDRLERTVPGVVRLTWAHLVQDHWELVRGDVDSVLKQLSWE